LGARTPEEVVAGAVRIGSERFRQAARRRDARQVEQLTELASALREDPGGALAFAAEALRRERMPPQERARQKTAMAMAAAMHGKPVTPAQRDLLVRHGMAVPGDRWEASQLIDSLLKAGAE
jgi:hypothetical protein